MYFHSIYNYNEAKDVFNRVKQKRGTDKLEEGVPLERNRSCMNTRRLMYCAETGAYTARLYDTDCVTWYENGAIAIDCSYPSTPTATFINQFNRHYPDTDSHERKIPFNMCARYCRSHEDIMVLEFYKTQYLIQNKHVGDTFLFTIRGKEVPFNSDAYTVNLCSGGVVTVTTSFAPPEDRYIEVDMANVRCPYKRKMDKKVAAQVRKPYAPFFEYFKFFADDLPDDAAIKILTASDTSGKSETREFIATPDDESLWPVIMAGGVLHYGGDYQQGYDKFRSKIYGRAYKMHGKNLRSTVYLDEGVHPQASGVRIDGMTYGERYAVDI